MRQCEEMILLQTCLFVALCLNTVQCHKTSNIVRDSDRDKIHRDNENIVDYPNKFHDPEVVQDEGHIQEHLDEQTNLKVENMTTEEIEFHYFRLHDSDNNTKLDGLEILAALTHMMPPDEVIPRQPENNRGKTIREIKIMEQERRDKVLDYYVSIIDQVLEEDDANHDGYLTYMEYVLARRRDEETMQKQQDKQIQPSANTRQ